MVDQQPLTPEQKILVEKLLARIRPQQLICPICKTDNFTLINGYIVRAISNNPTQFQLGGQIIPTVSLVCNKCGHILDFSAIPLGVVNPPSVNPYANKPQLP